jgi:hypothetical protein
MIKKNIIKYYYEKFNFHQFIINLNNLMKYKYDIKGIKLIFVMIDIEINTHIYNDPKRLM